MLEALRRFDAKSVPIRPQRKPAPGWWAWLAQPRVASFASIVLVALISAPFVWNSFGTRLQDASSKQAEPLVAEMAPASSGAETAGLAPAPAQPAQTAQAAQAAKAQAQAVVGEERDAGLVSPLPASIAPGDAPPPAPASPAVAAMEGADMREAPIMTASQPAAPMRQDKLMRAANGNVAKAARVEESDIGDIVVTSARSRPRASAGRGDWNACTVEDPGQELQRCKAYLNPKREDEALIAKGLDQAWSGNYNAAIRFFDDAIAIAPRSSLAYLNRGLANRRNGDLGRAIADLDSAVRYAPGSARTYYNRSLILRESGDQKRAARDEQHAVELDFRYAEIIGN